MSSPTLEQALERLAEEAIVRRQLKQAGLLKTAEPQWWNSAKEKVQQGWGRAREWVDSQLGTGAKTEGSLGQYLSEDPVGRVLRGTLVGGGIGAGAGLVASQLAPDERERRPVQHAFTGAMVGGLLGGGGQGFYDQFAKQKEEKKRPPGIGTPEPSEWVKARDKHQAIQKQIEAYEQAEPVGKTWQAALGSERPWWWKIAPWVGLGDAALMASNKPGWRGGRIKDLVPTNPRTRLLHAQTVADTSDVMSKNPELLLKQLEGTEPGTARQFTQLVREDPQELRRMLLAEEPFKRRLEVADLTRGARQMADKGVFDAHQLHIIEQAPPEELKKWVDALNKDPNYGVGLTASKKGPWRNLVSATNQASLNMNDEEYAAYLTSSPGNKGKGKAPPNTWTAESDLARAVGPKNYGEGPLEVTPETQRLVSREAAEAAHKEPTTFQKWIGGKYPEPRYRGGLLTDKGASRLARSRLGQWLLDWIPLLGPRKVSHRPIGLNRRGLQRLALYGLPYLLEPAAKRYVLNPLLDSSVDIPTHHTYPSYLESLQQARLDAAKVEDALRRRFPYEK